MRSTGRPVSPVLAIDVVGIANAVAAIGGFVAILGLVYVAARPDRDREREDEARAHYDRHGSWPDDG
jgi:alpha-glucuronidase